MKHPYIKSFRIVGIAGIAAILPVSPFLVAQPAGATESTVTIYSDNFNRTGDLAGSSPVVGTDAPSWASNATYTASADLTLANNQVEVANSRGNSNAYLPVTLTPGSGIYTLTLTLALLQDSPSAEWLGFGFANGITGTDIGYSEDIMGRVSYSRGGTFTASIIKNTNLLPTVAKVSGGTGAIPLTVSIILDTYKTENNMTFRIDNGGTTETIASVGTIVGSLSEGQIRAIQAIKFGSTTNQGGQFDDLSFTVTTITQVPEPGTTAAILAFAIFGLAIVVRRRAIR